LPALRKKIHDFTFDESGNVNRMNLALLVVVVFAFTLCFVVIAKHVRADEGGAGDDSSAGNSDTSGGPAGDTDSDSNGGPSSSGGGPGPGPAESRTDSGGGGDSDGDSGGTTVSILGHLFQTTLVYNQNQIIATSRMIR